MDWTKQYRRFSIIQRSKLQRKFKANACNHVKGKQKTIFDNNCLKIIYTHRTMDWNGRLEALWRGEGGDVQFLLLKFCIQEVSFQRIEFKNLCCVHFEQNLWLPDLSRVKEFNVKYRGTYFLGSRYYLQCTCTRSRSTFGQSIHKNVLITSPYT